MPVGAGQPGDACGTGQSPPSAGFLLVRGGELAHRAYVAALRPLGLDPKRLAVLGLLATAGPLPQGEIGEGCGIDRSTMVAVIDDLEREGLVERRRDPVDRRRYAMRLTPAGAAARERGAEARRACEEALLLPLDEAERTALRDLLRRVVEGADATA